MFRDHPRIPRCWEHVIAMKKDRGVVMTLQPLLNGFRWITGNGSYWFSPKILLCKIIPFQL